MIALSNAALRYAAESCVEFVHHAVVIFVQDHADEDLVRTKLHTYIKNKPAKIVAGRDAFSVRYDNGSTIRIARANDTSRGIKCDLAIVSMKASRDFVDTVVMPSERHSLADTHVNPDLYTARRTVRRDDIDSAMMAIESARLQLSADMITGGALSTANADAVTVVASSIPSRDEIRNMIQECIASVHVAAANQ